MKRTKRRYTEGLILEGPDRAKVAQIERVDERRGTCSVSVDGSTYTLPLEHVDFGASENDSAFGGFTPDEAFLLDDVLGDQLSALPKG